MHRGILLPKLKQSEEWGFAFKGVMISKMSSLEIWFTKEMLAGMAAYLRNAKDYLTNSEGITRDRKTDSRMCYSCAGFEDAFCG